MKKPDGSIDLIGGGIQLLNNITSLVVDFAPDAETRKQNRTQHKIKVAIRQLKNRFKTSAVSDYVNVNFADLGAPERENIIAYLRGVVNRD
jgi:hypothetical protein